MRRPLLIYTGLVFGGAMVIVGLLTFLTDSPHPELATGGGTLILTTLGIAGRNGGGKGLG